jgi:hypothetical protein
MIALALQMDSEPRAAAAVNGIVGDMSERRTMTSLFLGD